MIAWKDTAMRFHLTGASEADCAAATPPARVPAAARIGHAQAQDLDGRCRTQLTADLDRRTGMAKG